MILQVSSTGRAVLMALTGLLQVSVVLLILAGLFPILEPLFGQLG